MLAWTYPRTVGMIRVLTPEQHQQLVTLGELDASTLPEEMRPKAEAEKPKRGRS